VKVVFNGTPARPGVVDGASTFAVNVMAHLPDALPDVEHVYYVAPGVSVPSAANVELRVVPEAATGWRRVLWETVELGRELRRVGADVLVSPHESLPIRTTTPIVVVAQNLAYHREDGSAFPGATAPERVRAVCQRAYYRQRMPRAYARAAAVVAVSETAAATLAARAGLDRAKTTVVLEGADSLFLPPPPDPPPARAVDQVVYVSTLAPYKNIERAIEALALLRRERPAVRLILVGGEWNGFAAVLRRAAAANGVADAVAFAGALPPDVLGPVYTEATLLLHLSQSESFGLPAVEAMRYGLPVVCAHGSAVAQVAAGAAVTVDPSDPAAIAAVLGRLLASPNEREHLRTRGLARARQLTWRDTAARIAEVIRSVASAQG
jgi:glycosyltransferase involved in cell wall biosynthesis